MEIRLLKNGYKNNEEFFQAFLNDKVSNDDDYLTNETIYISEAPDFPIYMGRGGEEEKKKEFLKAFNIIRDYYIKTPRDVHFNELFWHSLLITKKREFLLKEYPGIMESLRDFNNIVIKKFDWENYIYKCVLGTEYVVDHTNDINAQNRYFNLILENLDLYNYIIKYEIFRNSTFLMNILDIIDELGVSDLMKAKIKGRDDLGKDERYGRRVILEFNKSYPVVMSPALSKGKVKEMFLEYLSYYYDVSKL